MTQFEFIELCEEMTIAPEVALESDNVKTALALAKATGDDGIVVRVLDMEF